MKLTIDIDEDDIKLFNSMSLERVANTAHDLVEACEENLNIRFLDKLLDLKLDLEELAIPLERLNSAIRSAYHEAKQTFTNGSFDQAVGRTKRPGNAEIQPMLNSEGDE